MVQNGPGTGRAPHWDEYGLLHLYRSFDFEPAVNLQLRWEDGVKQASQWFARGLPFLVSIHSINFQSTLASNRQKTLPMLNEFLDALKMNHPDLVYVNSRQLLEIVETGSYESGNGRVSVAVTGPGNGGRV